MTGAARVRSVLFVLVLALAGLTGCVQVPTAGPIKRVDGQSEACQNCINVEVAPPAPGDDPRQVVEGYLRATSNYQPYYSTARQFLTAMAAQSWRPEQGVKIYNNGTLNATESSATFAGQLVGEVGLDRTYTAADRPFEWDFRLIQENGEWRISHPPEGLMVTEFSFTSFYTGYSTYFVGSRDASLVPERIYLPALRNPANIASALLTALLDGPSRWLEGAAGTAIPTDNSLSVASVTITDGIAEVPLNDTVMALSDSQRSIMAAQIVYTLRQVSGVKGVLITVNKQGFPVPGADPTTLVIPLDAVSREIDPVPFVSDRLYAVKKAEPNPRLNLVTTPGESAGLQEMLGPLGRGRFTIDSLAVSLDGTDVAVVTDGGTVLRRAAIDTEEVATLQTGLTKMQRPQFTRYGEIWTIGERGGRQRLWLSSPDRNAEVVAPELDKGEVTAFRVSPDGARIALVRRTATGDDELGLAPIVRADKVTVGAWRPVSLRQTGSTTQVNRIEDVAWLDANELMLLGAGTDEAAPVPVRVIADASRVIAETGEADWGAQQLAVLSRPQTATVVGRDGRSWRNDGNQWLPLLDGIVGLAYAG